MICLGIESTAHTFGIAILKDKKILANVKDSYTTKSGGIIPTDAAKHHHKVKDALLEKALSEAKIDLDDIDIIAYSQGPGLAPCLLQGLHFAKELSKKYNKPLVGVNHCIAHLEIGKIMTKAKDPVLLYCSGANTQIIAYASGKYRIFGETLDMGIGNFIDSFARYAGLGFPGGPKIAELAKRSEMNTFLAHQKSKDFLVKSNNFIELPYSVKGMDVSFSGLLTNLQQKYNKGMKIEDLSFSLQETAFAMLIETAERAMAHLHKKELLLGGGVACNQRLQEMCKIMCKERKAKFFCPPNSVLVDNAAMIAWTGILMFKAGIKIPEDRANINPYERTDDIKVTW